MLVFPFRGILFILFGFARVFGKVCFLVPPSLTLLALRVRYRFKCSYSSHLNFHIRENPHQNLT
ncbi:MAG: hypothetical protein LBQ24_05230, partial [Candidatus Peribacteria bacterium]|nr:hypothetical protein [Candidatus Peribacteria bacterium]